MCEAAKLILGAPNCRSVVTGELCDSDTLAEALQYAYALQGYEAPAATQEDGEVSVSLGDDQQNVPVVPANLVFTCADLVVGHAVADSFAQVVEDVQPST